MKKIIPFLILLVLTTTIAIGQSVGIGTSTPDASSVLELKANNKGFLPPRMTSAEKGLIASPKAGLMIYQTDGSAGLYVYNGTTWTAVAGTGGSAGWALSGNSGTDAASNFIGTTDARPLSFKVQNTYAGRIGADGSVAFGKGASAGAFTHPSIVAVGLNALTSNGAGAVGIFEGTANTALGSEALTANTKGYSNTGIGSQALKNNSTGVSNTAVGAGALFSSTTASNNTATGYNALYLNETGTANTSMGYRSLTFNKTGNDNTALGYQALNANTANWNTAVGSNALTLNTGGGNNAAIGFMTLSKNTSGNGNTALGSQALKTTDASFNTAIGASALSLNTQGEWNVAMGVNALIQNATGDNNVAIGSKSLYSSKTGINVTALGNNTDVGFTDLSNATVIGANAYAACDNCMILGSVNGVNNATANIKVGIGTNNPSAVLHVNPNGAGSVLVGSKENTGTTLEMGVTAKLAGSGYVQAVQATNSSWGALLLNPGGGNVGVGYPTASNINSTLDVKGSLGLGDNVNKWQFIGGTGAMVFNYTGAYKAAISQVDGHYTEASDARLKKNVQKMRPGVLAKVLALQPKTYQYIANENTEYANHVSTGFIAQEVKELFPEMVSEMPNKGQDSLALPSYLGVNYAGFSVIAIKAIQEQQAEMDVLKNENKMLKEKMEKVEAAIAAINENKK